MGGFFVEVRRFRTLSEHDTRHLHALVFIVLGIERRRVARRESGIGQRRQRDRFGNAPGQVLGALSIVPNVLDKPRLLLKIVASTVLLGL